MSAYYIQFRAARLAAGVTINDAARAAGVHSQTVSKFERGVQDLGLLAIDKLAAAYGTTTDEIIRSPLPSFERVQMMYSSGRGRRMRSDEILALWEACGGAGGQGLII